MANYNTVITNEGAALLASVIANHGTITFTDLKLSENDYTGQETTMTAGTFDGVFADVVVASSIVDITTIKVSATVHGYNISGDHNLYALGVIGTDGNTTALIAICTTTNPDVLRDNSSTYAFNINLSVSDTSQITVVGTTAAVLYDVDVVDTLISTATDKPLSANMGKKLSDEKQDKTLATPITVDGTQETTVEGALGALNTYSDKIKDNLSNRNLVDNGWFTINQRGVTSGTIVANTPIVDRWKVDLGAGSPTWALTSSGITLTPATNSYAYIYQQLADGSALIGKQLTVSVKLSDGAVLSTSFTRVSATNQFETKNNVRMGINASDRVAIYAMDGVSKTIRAVKLELGTVSTLALDVEPDYTTELLKCQRYFERIKLLGSANSYALFGIGYADSTAVARVIIWCQPKRTLPTLSFTGSFYLGTNAVTGMTAQQMTNAGIAANVASSGLVQNDLYVLTSGNTGYYIDLSADL